MKKFEFVQGVAAAEAKTPIGHAALAIMWRSQQLYPLLVEPELAFVFCQRREYIRLALVSLARSGNKAADGCLRGMAEFLTEIGEPLPLWLQEHVILFSLSGDRQRERGRSAAANIIRDAIIGQAVQMVADQYEISPTRNQATIAECGCSIVSKALEKYCGYSMSEANVTQIWRRTAGAEIHLWSVMDTWQDLPTIRAY